MKHYSLRNGEVSTPSNHVPKQEVAQKDLMPFGKYRGQDIVDLPSSYLKWCCLQDWFEERYRGLLKAIDEELKFRDKRGCHFEEEGGRRG
jgi:uncharacterized protein (DUF3820 family)